MGHKLNATTGMFPSWDHPKALEYLRDTEIVDCFGWIATDHVQLCPQNQGEGLDYNRLLLLKLMMPNTQLRLHADVHVIGHPRRNHDAIDFVGGLHVGGSYPYSRFWDMIRYHSELIGATVYSLHAGNRAKGGLGYLHTNMMAMKEFFALGGIRVAVEGLYPIKGNALLISSWKEYAWLLETGLDFAIDLSHLNIVAKHEHKVETNLVREMISSPNCLEVHVSANDGHQDLHLPVDDPDTWWLPLLKDIHPDAVLFCESNYHTKRRLNPKGVPTKL